MEWYSHHNLDASTFFYLRPERQSIILIFSALLYGPYALSPNPIFDSMPTAFAHSAQRVLV
jgi:hypothetical protein